MAFSAAGFFGQVNANITDKRQYVRARVEEDRLYLREQGLKRQGAIQEQRGQYEQAARSLTNRGADERRVLSFLENNPSGLMELYRRTDNDNDVTGANLNDMMVIGEDYQSDATMDEILDSILPAVQAMPNDTSPVESRRSSIASWLGLDTEDALSNEVYNQQIVGGMTGDQIMSSMNLPIQAQGSGAASATLDLSSLGSANTISATDANAYYDRANGDYDVAGMILSLKEQVTSWSAEGGVPPSQEDRMTINDNINTLEALPSSGPARLNGIFESGLFPVGDNTRDLMSSNLGAQLFGVENFSAGARATLGFDSEDEDTSEAAVNASGTPAADPNAIQVQTPTDNTVRPEGRPARPSVAQTALGEKTATTLEDAIEYARTVRENDKDATDVTVPLSDGSEVTIRADQVPDLTVEESDDRANLLTILREGKDMDTVFDALEAYSDKYGREAARAVERMSQTDAPAQPRASMLDNAFQKAASVSTPAVPLPEIPVEEAIADQEMLQAAVSSSDIEQDELDTILQNFIDRYGLEAARNVVGQAQNQG
jgi:hypothetical protein